MLVSLGGCNCAVFGVQETMATERQREKRAQVIAFFVEKRQCSQMVLSHLLFLFDFAHFRETGRSSTGLKYLAGRSGPVPVESGGAPIKLEAGALFNPLSLTQRELCILDRIVSSAEDVAETIKLKGTPWHQVFEVEGRRQGEIPYELALDSTEGSLTLDQARMIAEERREAEMLFGLMGA